jgi:digeranylgeranylglycerophospholipid reductase
MIDRRKEIGYPVQCGELLPRVAEMYSIFPRAENLEELFTVPGSYIRGASEKINICSPRRRVYSCDFESYTLDRRAYDKYLVTLAEEAGARLELGTSLLSISDGVAKTSLGDIRAKVIVGADGPNSRTARQAGLKNPRRSYPAVTCQASGDFDPEVMMFFGSIAPGGYAWIIPKEQGANAGIGFNPDKLEERPREVFDRFIRTLSCDYSDVTMGFVPLSGPVPSTVSRNVLLVGDAAGHTMATNGGGIPTAMIAGRIAGNVIKAYLAGDCELAEYERRWRSVMNKPLQRAVRIKRMADLVFPSDSLLGMSMFLLGRRGLDRSIRCKRLLL